jgi:hypothetical protein
MSFWIDSRARRRDAGFVQVGGENLHRHLAACRFGEHGPCDGGGIRLLPGRAADGPDAHRVVLLAFVDQAREDGPPWQEELIEAMTQLWSCLVFPDRIAYAFSNALSPYVCIAQTQSDSGFRRGAQSLIRRPPIGLEVLQEFRNAQGSKPAIARPSDQ